MLAQAAIVGMNPLQMLRTTSLAESVVLTAICSKAAELMIERDEHLAALITSKIVSAWNRGQGS